MPNFVKTRSISLLLMALLLVTACGQKRALYLPEEPKSNGESNQPKSEQSTAAQGNQ